MSGRFLTELEVRQIGPRHWQLTKDLIYRRNDGRVIVVPEGFTTDFASVPRPLWILWPPSGPYTPAAVVHDWLYHVQDRPRAAADALFLEAMENSQVSWITRRCLYRGVRLGGWVAWNNYAKEVANVGKHLEALSAGAQLRVGPVEADLGECG